MKKKNRNIAVAAVARKLTVAIWHLLKGHFTPMLEMDKHLQAKLLKIATVLGTESLEDSGFENRNHGFQHLKNNCIQSLECSSGKSMFKVIR